jgi:hypothetical protein
MPSSTNYKSNTNSPMPSQPNISFSGQHRRTITSPRPLVVPPTLPALVPPLPAESPAQLVPTRAGILGPDTLCAIVSAYDRPEKLRLVLQCMKVQTFTRDLFDVIVTDDSADGANLLIAKDFGYRGIHTQVRDCYAAAEIACKATNAVYVWFPSDDDWFCPHFAERLMQAAYANAWDLVYCDMLWGPRTTGKYEPWQVTPRVGRIDKAGFIVRRKLVIDAGGFPEKKRKPNCSDGMLVERIVRKCFKYGKVNEVLWCHG